ncbi:MAG: class F sortase [Egibacteraceae bacterium]
MNTWGNITLSLGIMLMFVALPPIVAGVRAATSFALMANPQSRASHSTVLTPPSLVGRPHDVQLAEPRRVIIPKIHVQADVVPLGLERDGSLQVPEDFSASGWYVDGPEPGEPGAAVIVGHVDSYDGPAVFYGLDKLTRGDEVLVEAADGTASAFVVDRVEQHAKAEFPTDEVYGNTERPTLRLITCGGAFDRFEGSYRDNVVVFAQLAS